jgi:hypothetical protein
MKFACWWAPRASLEYGVQDEEISSQRWADPLLTQALENTIHFKDILFPEMSLLPRLSQLPKE